MIGVTHKEPVTLKKMFSPKQVHRNPADIELVREVTLQEISDWFLEIFAPLSEQILSSIRDLDAVKEGLSPIYKEMKNGDTIWLCRSIRRAPLIGNEGVALVRNEQPLIYIRVIQY
jgi:hypothetical protein